MAAASAKLLPRPPFAARFRPAVDPEPFPLDGEFRWVDLGPDEALAAVLRRLGIAASEAIRAEAVAGDPGAAKAVILSHPLGFPSDGKGWRAWCDERKLVLVEDARHALFAWTPDGPTGSHGHAAIFSLKETLGVSGCLIVGTAAQHIPETEPPKLLAKLADPGDQGRRRGHYLALAESFSAKPGFERVPDGAAPLVFPRQDGVALPVHPGAPRHPVDGTGQGVSLAAAEDLWRTLEEPTGNLFTTWDFASTWWEHFGEGRELHVMRVGDKAILPLYRSATRPLSIVRLIGHGPADRLAPLAAPADRAVAGAALRRAVAEIGPDLFVSDETPVEEGWAGTAGGVTVRREPSPVLNTRGLGFDAFLKARSRNFREQVRRRERALRKQHDVQFRLTQSHAELETDFDALVALHEQRWQGASDAFEPGRRAFHKAFAHKALDNGWLRLWTLELDGVAVAAWLGFRYANAEWFYQSGRDPERDKQSIGFVLLSHTVRAAMDDGVDEYRLLRGGEEYKARFATYDAGLETLAIATTAKGRAAIAGASAVRALPHGLRRRILQRTG